MKKTCITIQIVALFLALIISINKASAQCTTTLKDSLDQLTHTTFKEIKPILIDQYKGDWFALIRQENTLDVSLKEKLTEFRRNVVFAMTCDVQDLVVQKELQERKKLIGSNQNSDFLKVQPLKANFGGSESFSSDIDVNLKGDGTEYAVEFINQEFKKDLGINKEMGELLDINFYAKDFVPDLSKDQKKENDEDHHFYDNDDWRTYIFQSPTFRLADIQFQTKLSLVFMRKNMKEEDFANYLQQITKQKVVPASLILAVDEEFIAFQQRIQEAKGNSEMAKENRAYELLLETSAHKRIEFEWQKEQNNTDLDLLYLEWKKAKTLCTLHANEAHCTEGAIVHVVANKQMLSRLYKGKTGLLKLRLTEHELYHSFNEQIGFAFHKLDHTESKEDLIKLGKYMHRAYNALKHFYVASNLSPIYSEAERKAATDWEGLKKGKKRDANGKFTISVPPEERIAELTKILNTFETRFQAYGLGDDIGDLENLAILKANLKTLLIHLKIEIDQQYFTKFQSLYSQ